MQQPVEDKVRDLGEVWALIVALRRFTISVRPDLKDALALPYPRVRIVRADRNGIAPRVDRENSDVIAAPMCIGPLSTLTMKLAWRRSQINSSKPV